MDKSPKDQLIKRITEAGNVLVTVSTDPSVDQLAAAIGLTLFLSKQKKHATVVFSGQIPSTLEFLKPEQTIEENTDSLQDFIIALDKNKADKIRYKVEDQVVKIFITPYRSSIDQEDLQFSKGDFNVDVVVALGVHSKDDLDQAITAHGRILHDATVATVNLKEGSELGAINWTDPQASSLCEMAVVLADSVKPNSFDAQMATALLTGIVAETERFSNDKTTSGTMSASAKLMAAGANQQLVATKLEAPEPAPQQSPKKENEASGEEESSEEGGEESSDGTLRIAHDENEPRPPKKPPKKPESEPKPEPQPKLEPRPEPEPEKPIEQIEIDQEGELAKKGGPQVRPPEPPPLPPSPPKPPEPPQPQIKAEPRKFLEEPPSTHRHKDAVIGGPAGQSLPNNHTSAHMVTAPPSLGGKLSAMAEDFHADEGDDTPLSLPPVAAPPILTHDAGKTGKTKSQKPPTQPPIKPVPPSPSKLPEPPMPPSPPAPAPPIPAPPSASPPPHPKQPPFEPPGIRSKLPSSFVDTLDDRTLKELERKTGSPHRTQAAADLDDKTLQAIEKTVNSSHQVSPPSAISTPVKDIGLDYEPHESEPPAKEPAKMSPPPKKSVEKPEPKKPVIKPPAPTPPPPKPPEPPKQPEPMIPPAPAPVPPFSQTEATAARDAVTKALDTHDEQEPLKSAGTQGAMNIPHPSPSITTSQGPQKPSPNIENIDEEGKVTFAPATPTRIQPPDHTAASVENPTAPPPVPPPMVPPTATNNE